MTPRPAGRRSPCTIADARARLHDAEAFLEAAETARDPDVIAANAIHSAIAATVRLGWPHARRGTKAASLPRADSPPAPVRAAGQDRDKRLGGNATQRRPARHPVRGRSRRHRALPGGDSGEPLTVQVALNVLDGYIEQMRRDSDVAS
jgi:hypothetical protein